MAGRETETNLYLSKESAITILASVIMTRLRERGMWKRFLRCLEGGLRSLLFWCGGEEPRGGLLRSGILTPLPEGAADQDMCVICTDGTDAAPLLVTECGHVYHERCLSLWLHKRRSCPVCSRKIPGATEKRSLALE